MATAANRPVIDDLDAVRALAHPVRLDVLNHLMAEGPATASACARAVGDTPSNCSYHLRVLARHGLVEAQPSADARERPWRATVTGFSVDEMEPGTAGDAGAAQLLAASVALDQRLARDYLGRRGSVPARWRAADTYSQYSLRVTPAELAELVAAIDGLVRPYIAATRVERPAGSAQVHVGLQAFPRDVP
ncbi:helix-turn-helix transcriptional regulator [Jatrophihabitans endophyticus]|uniref:ArsR/SmtB family transcription factor n=1 Tax=Jatrophihabitans endophyticus TaxID=1206085 RepID=UPI001A07AEE3|nr:helix-turn-helix domain-containing protein [Jatrophihabitans endophyticus]MBE7188929.1 helix-turn-helix domain-containing protein [Jatrophihabitans endophyticus]